MIEKALEWIGNHKTLCEGIGALLGLATAAVAFWKKLFKKKEGVSPSVDNKVNVVIENTGGDKNSVTGSSNTFNNNSTVINTGFSVEQVEKILEEKIRLQQQVNELKEQLRQDLNRYTHLGKKHDPYFIKKADATREELRILEVRKVIQEGKSKQHSKFSEASSVIESQLPMFASIGKDIEDGIDEIVSEFKSEFTFTLHESGGIKEFLEQFKKNSGKELLTSYQATLSYAVGEGNNGFGTTFVYILRTAKGVESDQRFKFLENKPYIVFHLCDSEKLNKNGKTQNYYAVPTDSGTLKLLNWSMEEIKMITVSEIIEMVRNSVTDTEVWKVVYS